MYFFIFICKYIGLTDYLNSNSFGVICQYDFIFNI